MPVENAEKPVDEEWLPPEPKETRRTRQGHVLDEEYETEEEEEAS